MEKTFSKPEIKFIAKIRNPFDLEKKEFKEMENSRSLSRKRTANKKNVHSNSEKLNDIEYYTVFSGNKESGAVMVSETGIPGSILNRTFKDAESIEKIEDPLVNNATLFEFPGVFDERISNKELYDAEYKDHVGDLFHGRHSCFLFFGPSNGGKDFSIFGDGQKGILEMSVADILAKAKIMNSDKKSKFNSDRMKITIGGVEILSKKVYDVMATGKKHLIKTERRKDVRTGGWKLTKFDQEMTEIGSEKDFEGWVKNFETKQAALATKIKAKKKSHLVVTVRGEIVRKVGQEEILVQKDAFLLKIVKLRSTNQSLNPKTKKKKKSSVQPALKSITTCFSDLARLNIGYYPTFESKLTLVLSDVYVKKANFVVCGCLLATDKVAKSSQQAVMVES